MRHYRTNLPVQQAAARIERQLESQRARREDRYELAQPGDRDLVVLVYTKFSPLTAVCGSLTVTISAFAGTTEIHAVSAGKKPALAGGMSGFYERLETDVGAALGGDLLPEQPPR